MSASVCSTGRPAAPICMPVGFSAWQTHFTGRRSHMKLPAVPSARKLQGASRGPGLEMQTHCRLTTCMQVGSQLSVSLQPCACQSLTACTVTAQQADQCCTGCAAALPGPVEASCCVFTTPAAHSQMAPPLPTAATCCMGRPAALPCPVEAFLTPVPCCRPAVGTTNAQQPCQHSTHSLLAPPAALFNSTASTPASWCLAPSTQPQASGNPQALHDLC